MSGWSGVNLPTVSLPSGRLILRRRVPRSFGAASWMPAWNMWGVGFDTSFYKKVESGDIVKSPGLIWLVSDLGRYFWVSNRRHVPIMLLLVHEIITIVNREIVRILSGRIKLQATVKHLWCWGIRIPTPCLAAAFKIILRPNYSRWLESQMLMGEIPQPQ